MENLVDGYGRPVLDRKERQLIQAVESKSAMVDYKRAEQHRRDNLTKLRTARLEREKAVNKPVGDNARKGAVKKRTQLPNKLAGGFTKRDKTDGEFMAVKKTKKFKGVRKERAA
jgi:hypothetical protein